MDTGTIAQTVGTWIWPRVCAHCREDLSADADTPLCLACRLKLTPSEPPYCLRCAEPVRRGSHCARCERRVFACSPVRAAFAYRDAAVSLVHSFKYGGRRSAARAAGDWMASAWSRYPELGVPDALVPMPLHPRRRRQRGYNQALLIAQAMSERLGIPVLEALVRERETPPQWSLGRAERAKNVAGAFSAVATHRFEGRKLLLVDDVCTSGSSLEACAQTLLRAGAARVSAYVFARQVNVLGEG